MEKHISGLLLVIAAVFLLVGGLVGYDIGEAQIETNTITETVYQNVSVTEIEYISLPSELDRAVQAFLIAVEDEAVNDSEVDVLTDFTDGSYDFDEIEVSRIYDYYTVEYDDEVTTVNFSIKLRYDEDGEASEKETFDVSVRFEEDEDTEVIVA